MIIDMRTLREWLGVKPRPRQSLKEVIRNKKDELDRREGPWLFKEVSGTRELQKAVADGWQLVDSTPVTVNGTRLFTSYSMKKRNPALIDD